MEYISGDGDLPRKIANAHTIFNVFTTLILLPFIPLFAKICEKIIPSGNGKVKFQKLEPHLLDTPEIALSQTVTALRKMLKKAWKMVDCALKTYNQNDEINQKRVKNLEEKEARVDLYQHDITNYLSELMSRSLTHEQALRISKLIHCTNDAERIGDHTAIIANMISTFLENKGKLSDACETEFMNLHRALADQARCTLDLLERVSRKQLARASALEQQVRHLCDD